MLKKAIFLLLIFNCFLSAVKAQPTGDFKKNMIYMEYFGNGFFYSLNYERIFREKDNIKMAGRVGATCFSLGDEYDKNIGAGIPLEFVHFNGKGKHHFELGFGITPLHYRKIERGYTPGEYITFTSFYRIGYRYGDFSKEGKNGAFFKIAMLPLFGTGFKIDSKSSYDIFRKERFFSLTSIGLAYGIIF